MFEMRPRMAREARTMEIMVAMYCRDLHRTQQGTCEKCRELVEYAYGRLDKCPYQEGKTTCAKCPIHCYKPALREQMRAVMRYAGPRMLWRHPILTILHLWDGLRKGPTRARREPVG
jgi:hypothetical protein